MVLRRVQMGHASFEECKLQILHLQPVYDFRVQIKPESIDQTLDVVHRFLRVPTGIDMQQQWPKPEFLYSQIGQIRAVDTSTDSNDAVVALAPAFACDLVDVPLQHRSTYIIGMPVRNDVLVVVVTVVAPSPLVECDVRVGRIHDAVRAYLVGALR